MAELLAVEGLTCGYGPAVVLNDVSFTLEAGRSLALVLAEMPADEDELRAQLAGRAAGHAAAHAEGLGLIGGGEHHAAADGDWQTPKGRVKQLLDRGIEGVEVRMKYGRLHRHGVTGNPAFLP